MNQDEAEHVIAERLDRWKGAPYTQLVALISHPEVDEAVGPSGIVYQVDVQAVWDDRSEGNVRVICSVDDGGWRAFAPLSDGFVISPKGKLIGEGR